jgi:hypothetical protein
VKAVLTALPALLLLAPSQAGAETPATVFMARVQPPALQEATRRVGPELTAAGYRVSLEGCAVGLDEGCQQEWPPGAPAIAAVAFKWAGAALAIEARVARADRRTVRLETLVTAAPAPEPALVAVRTAELVRAGVLAVMHGPEAEVRAASSETARPTVGFVVALGPGLVQSVRGLGSAVGPSLRIGLTWRSTLVVSAWAISPTLTRSVRTAEGRAELRDDIAGAELGWRWRAGARLQPAVALGGGAYHLRVRGADVAPLAPTTSALWTPFLSGAVALAFALDAHWAIATELRTAITRRAPVVRVGDSEAGRTGWPVLVAGLVLEYRR